MTRRDRGESPTQRRKREARRTAASDERCSARERPASLGLKGLEVVGESLRNSRQRLEPMPRAERQKIGPVVGVGALGSRGKVRGGEVAVDRAGEVLERPRSAGDRGRRRESRALGGHFGSPRWPGTRPIAFPRALLLVGKAKPYMPENEISQTQQQF
jgi:hypothetical protein